MWTPRYGLHAVIVLAVLGRLAAAQESPEQILQQAITWHQKGDVERAIPQYREYLRIRPEASDVRSNLGAALASTGRYEEAIAEYQKALKGRPRETRIRLNLALALYKAGNSRRFMRCNLPSGRLRYCWPIAGSARERTARGSSVLRPLKSRNRETGQ